MSVALIRREYITHLDGVNRFIALLAEWSGRIQQQAGQKLRHIVDSVKATPPQTA